MTVGLKPGHKAIGLEKSGFGERVGGRNRPGQVLPEDGRVEEFASIRNVMILRDAEGLSCS